jgi:hypothetical protein
MGKPSKELLAFMEKHSVASDEVWEVRAGGAWAIKHSAIERIAAENKIVFDRPAIIEAKSEDKIAVVCVFGTMGDRTEWSFGEASPANNKNAYCWAMAEKRAKDRVALKLLNAHGTLYSEDEADDFKRQNPHVTRPTDIVPDVEYDQHGEPVDNIPSGDDGIERLPKAKARADYEACQKEMRANKTLRELEAWGAKNANRIASYPSDWAAIMRGMYAEHRDELRKELVA